MPSNPPRPRWAAPLLFALAAIACRDGAKPPVDVEPLETVPATPPRTVTLADGSRIDLRSPARRVFPASATVVDFLVALAPPERVAALPEQALDYSSLPGDGEAWRSIPRFSRYVAEEVIALSPD